MRLVFDTNVLIAALVARGVCADLLEHCILNHTLVTSQFILDELRQVLVGKFNFTTQEVGEAVALLESQMEQVIPVELERSVCRDADDDQVLATALVGQAHCIVTGDKDLLVISRYLDIEIMNPAGFADFEVTQA